MFIKLSNPLCTYLPPYFITKMTNSLANVWTDRYGFFSLCMSFFSYASDFLCRSILMWHHLIDLVNWKYVMKFKLHENINAPSETVYNIVRIALTIILSEASFLCFFLFKMQVHIAKLIRAMCNFTWSGQTKRHRLVKIGCFVTILESWIYLWTEKMNGWYSQSMIQNELYSATA